MENIKVIKGNLFNSKCQTIVNTINCVGVMGKGIALVYKLRYPKMFSVYQDFCKQGLISVGKLWLYKSEDINTPWVLNFPTKNHWRMPSEYCYIEKGLTKFIETYKEKGITSIAFPMLGTQNGGLDHDVVLRLMLSSLGKCDIPVEIYEFDPSVSDDLFEAFKQKWNSIPASQRKQITGIRQQRQIDTLDAKVNDPQTTSMMQLIDCEGVGIKTMECCFQVVMKYVKQNNLFDL